jgi:hypothetical protein
MGGEVNGGESNPAFNTTIDPSMPERIRQPQQTADQMAGNIWVLRWEDKNTADPCSSRPATSTPAP